MLYKKYDGKCQLCGKKLTLDTMTLDHIIPLALGGADVLDNIQIACFTCNHLKNNILPEDFLKRVTNVFMYQMEKKCKYNFQRKYGILWIQGYVLNICLYYRESEDTMLALKDTIKTISKDKKVTQLEMAEALGISKQNFSNKM